MVIISFKLCSSSLDKGFWNYPIFYIKIVKFAHFHLYETICESKFTFIKLSE